MVVNMMVDMMVNMTVDMVVNHLVKHLYHLWSIWWSNMVVIILLEGLGSHVVNVVVNILMMV